MPYLDPYIDAETPEEYEKIIKKLREEQEILKYQIQEAKKSKALYDWGPIFVLVIMVLIIAVELSNR